MQNIRLTPLCAKRLLSLQESYSALQHCQMHVSEYSFKCALVGVEPLEFPMLKRLISWSSSSAASKQKGARSSNARPQPKQIGSPCMLLAMDKVSKGGSAQLMSEIAKATVAECGNENVSDSAKAAYR